MKRALARLAQDHLKQALDRAPDERASFLDEACGNRTELRAEVESLLEALDKAGEFLETPAAGAPGASDAIDPRPMVGKHIGRYRIESLIASGGMGTVYLAVQDNPHRTVALKVMNAGVSSRSALRRFEYEAQILGRLLHPHIAQVYDAGTLDDGVPYFAMEYVADARPITEYAESETLPTRQRLELFVKVCDAVHHGHQKGIIHRDLKPTNILVDATGRPKIIDFGVARATDSDMAATTLRTDVGQLIGTLQYMSPEQCEADPGNLDIRSDVYSLGVVLYELICGHVPYDVSRTPVYEATRIIRDQPPVRPSTISKALRGDIETIVMKALEKDRRQRYSSASSLGGDIQRYLAHEAIEARPPTVLYQMRMFARRNRTLVSAIAAGMVVLAAATVVSLIFAVRAESARADAAEQRDAALWQAYVSDIAAADSAHQAHEYQRMRRSLDSALADHRNWEWRYLKRLAEPSLGVLSGHKHLVSAVAFSPDGRILASASWDDTIRLWDAVSGQAICTWATHDQTVLAVAFSPDGTRLASGARDATIRIHNVSTGEELARLEGHRQAVSSVAFSPDGERLASGSRDRTVRLWDARSGEVLATWAGHRRSVTGIAFSPDGRLLACSCDDLTIKLWDIATEQVLATLEGHRGGARSIAFSPDGAHLVAACLDKTVRVWDTAGAGALEVLRGHTDRVWSLAFSPDGTRFATGSDDNAVKLWSADTYQELGTLRGHEQRVQCIAFSPDGTRIASGSMDQTVRLWDASGDDISTLVGHTDRVTFVAFNPEGTRIASCSWDGTTIIWDTFTGQPLVALPESSPAASVVYSPDGRYLVSGTREGLVIVRDADTGQLLQTFRGHTDRVVSVAVSPDGAWIASASRDKTVVIWDRATGDERRRLLHESIVRFVAFSPDGRDLASGAADGVLRLWDMATGRLRLARPSHKTDVVSIAFTRDGKRLATGSWDGTISILDRATGDEVITLRGTRAQILSVAFSSDGTRITSSSREHVIRLWDISTGAEVAALHGHGSDVTVVAFSPDGTRLASGSGDFTVRLWDTVPLAVRLRERQAVLSNYADAESLVDRLWAELIQPSAVAAALRSDPQLDNWLRHAALNLVLRRAAPGRE